MKKKKIYINYKLISFLLIVFILAGCNKNPQKPNADKKGTLPKLPKVLTELEDEILTIMYDLDSITGIEKAIEEEKSIELEETGSMETAAKLTAQGQNDEKIKEGGEKQKQSGSAEEDKSKEIEETVDMQKLIAENEIIIPLLEANDVRGNFTESTGPPPDMDTVWNKTNDNIANIHRKWNVLEAQLPPGKASLEKIGDFEEILNDLTLSVVNREILDSLKSANELTGITADFRGHFDGIGKHDVYEMYYHIRGIILSAAFDNYAEAMEHLNETSKIGDSIRQDLIKKGSEDILIKFELSIEDLEEQLMNKNFYLAQIKAPIVIKNIRLIQDTFETEK